MLRITIDPGDGSEPHQWTLQCDPPGGDHPDPVSACAALNDAADPFAPVPKNAVCAQVYGGPQTADVEGEWRGTRVRTRYRRTNACEIARWEAVRPMLEPHHSRPAGRG